VGEIDFAPRGESLKGAAEIDRAIADLDIQVGLNVIRRSGQPFAASLIAQVVTLSEGRLGTDGRFHVPGPGGSERLWVANLEATPFREADLATQASRGVTIAMDVARAPDEAGGFADFVAFARDLARVLEGELVDDDHRPVNEDSLGAIQAEVDRVRARLVTLGLPAGSALAMRLFA
jgi:FtsZ-interacting cell division protein ZipA